MVLHLYQKEKSNLIYCCQCEVSIYCQFNNSGSNKDQLIALSFRQLMSFSIIVMSEITETSSLNHKHHRTKAY